MRGGRCQGSGRIFKGVAIETVSQLPRGAVLELAQPKVERRTLEHRGFSKAFL